MTRDNSSTQDDGSKQSGVTAIYIGRGGGADDSSDPFARWMQAAGYAPAGQPAPHTPHKAKRDALDEVITTLGDMVGKIDALMMEEKVMLEAGAEDDKRAVTAAFLGGWEWQHYRDRQRRLAFIREAVPLLANGVVKACADLEALAAQAEQKRAAQHDMEAND